MYVTDESEWFSTLLLFTSKYLYRIKYVVFYSMGRRKTYNVAECSNYKRQVNPEEDVEYTYWCCFPFWYGLSKFSP